MRPESYSILYGVAVAVAVGSAMLLAAQMAADPLGLTHQQIALMGVAASGLSVAASLLPRVTKPPSGERAGKD